MNHLQSVFKLVELDLRANNKLSYETLTKLSELPDWDYRIVSGFITEVQLALSHNNSAFIFKKYDYTSPQRNQKRYDLTIAITKRKKEDLCLTDVKNRLVIPAGITYDYIEVWGMTVENARNFCINKALETGSDYILFIDDDMIIENTGLLKLWDTIKETNKICVAGEYQKKADYVVSAHGNKLKNVSDSLYETDLAAMGFTLIDLNKLTEKVAAPYFWIFLAPDGLWSMGEDAFFTQNLISHCNEYPLIRTDISILHYDKRWKKCFGERNKDVTYATSGISDFTTFDHMRVSPVHPLIVIGVPKRKETDPVANNFAKLYCDRAYKTEYFEVPGMNVDHARNKIAEASVLKGSRYTLMVDDDVILPIDGLQKMIAVMENDIDEKIGMVVGDYLLKGDGNQSIHLQLDAEGKAGELNKIKDREELLEANWLCGMGCALIRTSVFRQIQYPWFMCHNVKPGDNDGGVNEDAHFSECLLMNGYKIIHHDGVKCLHIDFKTGTVYGFGNPINSYATHDAMFPKME